MLPRWRDWWSSTLPSCMGSVGRTECSVAAITRLLLLQQITGEHPVIMSVMLFSLTIMKNRSEITDTDTWVLFHTCGWVTIEHNMKQVQIRLALTITIAQWIITLIKKKLELHCYRGYIIIVWRVLLLPWFSASWLRHHQPCGVS